MGNLRLSTVNREIRKDGLTLHKGEGYFYFVTDDDSIKTPDSVYVFRLNDMTLEQWKEAARWKN